MRTCARRTATLGDILPMDGRCHLPRFAVEVQPTLTTVSMAEHHATAMYVSLQSFPRGAKNSRAEKRATIFARRLPATARIVVGWSPPVDGSQDDLSGKAVRLASIASLLRLSGMMKAANILLNSERQTLVRNTRRISSVSFNIKLPNTGPAATPTNSMPWTVLKLCDLEPCGVMSDIYELTAASVVALC